MQIFKIIFLLVISISLQIVSIAQSTKVSTTYDSLCKDSDLSLERKEFLLDSLLVSPDLTIDTLEVADRYYSIIKKCWWRTPKKAILLVDKIHHLGEKSNDPKNDFYSRNHHNRVLFNYEAKQYYEAIRAAEEYVLIYSEENKRLGKTLRFQAASFIKLGNLQEAINHYKKAISIFKSIKNNDELIKTYINLLGLYADYGEESEFTEALILMNKGNKILDTSLHDPYDEIQWYINEGLIYDLLEQESKAIEKYKFALELSKANDEVNSESLCHLNLSQLYKGMGEYKLAKESLLAAEELNVSGIIRKANIKHNFGELILLDGEFEQAITLHQEAINTICGVNYKSIEELPTLDQINAASRKIYVLNYLIVKGNSWKAYYKESQNKQHLEYALETYELADKFIDLIYFENSGTLSKLFWRKKGSELYFNAIETSYKLNQFEKAFYFSEKSSALLLLENVTDINAKKEAGISELVLQTELDKLNEIRSYETDLQYAIEDGLETDSIHDLLFESRKRYKSFVDSFETIYPQYYASKKDVQISSLQEIQKGLEAKEIILQYSMLTDRGYVNLISKTETKSIYLESINRSEIQEYLKLMSKPFATKKDKEDFAKTSFDIYKMLLPFANDDFYLAYNNINVVGDPFLLTIPFESLITEQNSSLGSDTYLLNKVNIHYNYSLSLTEHFRQSESKFDGEFLSFAPTTFMNQDLTELKISDSELKELESLFIGQTFQNEEASLENFFAQYGRSQIVHLSTHAGSDHNTPWIAFHNGKVKLNELYFLKNEADLVVLSACKTSQGELKKGEGIMNIARGFFNCGAKSVLTTLWEVNEKSTAEITSSFYHYLKSGESKSLSLRNAKLDYLKNHKNTSEASPFYWSSLIIMGNDVALFQQSTNWIPFVIAGVLLIFAGFIVAKRVRKKK